MDSFIRHHALKSSAAVIHNVGFAACDWQSLDLLSNLLTAHLSRLARLLSSHVEHCDREEPSVTDALLVLESVLGVASLDELADYVDHVAPFSRMESTLPAFPVRLADFEAECRLARLKVAKKISVRATQRVAEARQSFPCFALMGETGLHASSGTLDGSALGHDISLDSLASPIMAMRRPVKSLKRLHKAILKAPREQCKKRRELDGERALERAAARRSRAKERHERQKRKLVEKKYSAWRPPRPPMGTVWLEAVPLSDKSDPMYRSRRLFNELVVEKRSLTWPFLHPVQAEALGMTDYHDVVKSPMDLSVIRVKLLEGGYGGGEELFVSDCVLICDNCTLYHHEARIVHQLAKRLKAFITNRWDTILLAAGDSGQDTVNDDDADSDMQELDITAVEGIEAPSRLLKLDGAADEQVQEDQLESLLVFLQTKQAGCQELVSQLHIKMKELIDFKSKRVTARLEKRPVPSIPRVLKNIKNEIMTASKETPKERLVLRILRSDLGLTHH